MNYQPTCPRCLSTSRDVRVHIYPREGEPEARGDHAMINCINPWHDEVLMDFIAAKKEHGFITADYYQTLAPLYLEGEMREEDRALWSGAGMIDSVTATTILDGLVNIGTVSVIQPK